MNELGKVFVVVGLVVALVGALLWLGWGKWIGRLPGDIHYTRGGFSFNFPVMTCIVISVVLTIIFWLVQRSR